MESVWVLKFTRTTLNTYILSNRTSSTHTHTQIGAHLFEKNKFRLKTNRGLFDAILSNNKKRHIIVSEKFNWCEKYVNLRTKIRCERREYGIDPVIHIFSCVDNWTYAMQEANNSYSQQFLNDFQHEHSTITLNFNWKSEAASCAHTYDDFWHMNISVDLFRSFLRQKIPLKWFFPQKSIPNPFYFFVKTFFWQTKRKHLKYFARVAMHSIIRPLNWNRSRSWNV